MEVEKDNETQKEKSNKLTSQWQKKQKIKKLSDFKLTKDDKYLIKSNEDELREIVLKEINTNISKYSEEIESINSQLKKEAKSKKDNDDSDNNKENIENNKMKKHKKYLILKIKKLKKCLKDEGAIKARVKLLKLKKHKLITKKKKIDQSLGNLKNSLKRCLKCKRRGHLAENCPMDTNEETKDENEGKKENTKICYNCGSTEHNLYNCDKPVDYANLPYAECFKCKGKGHISANCPQNENGIYIRGGSCFICKGKDHLAKNCPQKQMKEEAFKQNNKKNTKNK